MNWESMIPPGRYELLESGKGISLDAYPLEVEGDQSLRSVGIAALAVVSYIGIVAVHVGKSRILVADPALIFKIPEVNLAARTISFEPL